MPRCVGYGMVDLSKPKPRRNAQGNAVNLRRAGLARYGLGEALVVSVRQIDRFLE